MKIFPLIAVFFLFVFNAKGQEALTLGNRILGGGMSFSQSDADNVFPFSNSLSLDDVRNNNSMSYSFSPYFGRFYKDHQMIGVQFSVRGSNAEAEAMAPDFEFSNQRSQRSFSLGGFLRQYFPFSEKFGVFVEEGVAVSRSVSVFNNRNVDLSDSTDPRLIRDFDDETKTWSGSIDAEVGIYFFILNELSIETRLARFFMAYTDSKHSRSDFLTGESQSGDGNNSNVNFQLVNNFSFDQIFTLNYYF